MNRYSLLIATALLARALSPARAADNSRVTPSLRALLLPTLTSTAFVGLAIAAAFALVHAEQRRARRRSIRAARVLGARLEAFLAGRVGARALRRATWGARSGRFWSAVSITCNDRASAAW